MTYQLEDIEIAPSDEWEIATRAAKRARSTVKQQWRRAAWRAPHRVQGKQQTNPTAVAATTFRYMWVVGDRMDDSGLFSVERKELVKLTDTARQRWDDAIADLIEHGWLERLVNGQLGRRIAAYRATVPPGIE